MPVERIVAFIRGESDERFDELALAAFGFQYEQIASYRDLCDRRGATPATIDDWQQVPAVPAATFRSLQLRAADPESELYRAVIDHSFPAACLEGMERPPVLSLIPPREQLESSPGFMADHLLSSWASRDSQVAFSRRGVEVAKARSFLAARQRDRRPTLILTTPTALTQFLEALHRRGLRFRLPAGSRLLASGGTSGRGGEPSRVELLTRLAQGLGLPAEGVVREYGPAELTSRFYAGYGRRGQPRPFRRPPWTRVRILDPETMAETPAGATGQISVFDLANVGSLAHLLTEDLGTTDEGGFLPAGGAASPTA